MTLVRVPTAAEVWARAAERGIRPSHFINSVTGEPFADDPSGAAAVQAVIANDILPDVVSEVNEAADAAAYPIDYPFDTATLAARFPSWGSAQITEKLAYQDARFHKAILKGALSDLEDRVNSDAEIYATWSAKHAQEAEAELTKGEEAVRQLARMIPAVATEQAMRPPLSGSAALRVVF